MKNARTLHDEAMAQLREAKAKREKDDASYKILLTEAFHLESEAAYLLKDKVEAEPTRSVLFRSAATLALECKEFDKAEQLVMTALASGEKVPPAIRRELSKVFEVAGKPQNFTHPADARRYYERALTLKDNHAELNTRLASVLEEQFSDYTGARSCYERALEIEPSNAGIYNNLAVLLVEHLGEYDKALSLYNQALKLDPEYADIHYNLAILLGEHFKNHTAARSHYEKALKFDPNHADAYYNLAVTLAKYYKENALARDLYKKACALDSATKSPELDAYFNRVAPKRKKGTSNAKKRGILSRVFRIDLPNSLPKKEDISFIKEKKYTVKAE